MLWPTRILMQRPEILNLCHAKIEHATQIKRFNDPETYILMGDAYRRQLDGGNAVTNYQKALTLNPKLAEAQMKIGIIYLTQNNREYFLPAFECSHCSMIPHMLRFMNNCSCTGISAM